MRRLKDTDGQGSESSAEGQPEPMSRLRTERIAQKVKQQTLADAVGISRRTLQHLESGDYDNPPLRLIVSLAYALGLPDWRALLEDEWQTPLPGTQVVAVAEHQATASGSTEAEIARYAKRADQRNQERVRKRPQLPEWDAIYAEVRATGKAEREQKKLNRRAGK
ncbi:MAG TPA: helix-turn-helix transcriptional regulator [Solirubrobacteraceae bacterium]|jgi:putative transcriptional regulator|nr:helix-turn-helix transcriptional regulator [Solirubrobacteraceae bacterium]